MKNKINYNLFLDDIREPENTYEYTRDIKYVKLKWDIVRNYNEFTEIIKTRGIPDVISFDHDLSDIHYEHQCDINYDNFTEKTGYDCAKWLIDYTMENNLRLPFEILIHSMNYVGSENIKSLFNTYYKVYKF